MRKSMAVMPLAASLCLVLGCSGAGGMPEGDPAVSIAGVALAQRGAGDPRHGSYVKRNLVSDGALPAEHTDPNLLNAWGLDALPTTPWWVADNGQGVSTLYDAQGIAQPQSPMPLVVAIPGASGPAAPSGLVANPTAEFIITLGGTTAPARFLFASEDGTVAAWTRTDPLSPSALKVVDASDRAAVFKGLALATGPRGSRLFATDFHNGIIRAYDGTFAEVTLPRGAFKDERIRAGFAPFGIRVIDGIVLVTYAMQDAAGHDDVKGPGFGFVDAYQTDGRLIARIASRGKLNSPWGLALAPARFGPDSRRLLVGNFGDGHILSFGLHRDDGRDRGEKEDDLDDDGEYLATADGPVAIDGLWALSFGNGSLAGPTNTLFFTSGPNSEADGLFGRIDFAPGMSQR